MTESTSARVSPYRAAAGFTALHWGRQRGRVGILVASMGLATLADVLGPVFAGQLVEAVAHHGSEAVSAALWALGAILVLGLLFMACRHVAYQLIVTLTLRIMADTAQETFARVQRFSTDWHASSFAGSVVRKITRGMYAFDLLDDTVLLALLPSLVVLIGSTITLSLQWPLLGAAVFLGSALYVAITITLSLRYVAPSARISNRFDTKLGGVLADAISCNAVVKAFGAEAREDVRLERTVGRWHRRITRTWSRYTVSGTVQTGVLLLLRALVLGGAVLLWIDGQANAGDIAFVLTTFAVVQGYLRDVGMHVSNLQRSVNDMEEMVALSREPFGVSDRPGARPIAIPQGRIRFEDVTFHYGGHATPLYRDFSVEIAAGERVGLVGRSGSGKTTFVKLVQRLYDVTGGRITIDGQDIAGATQASLRGQIAIVQQEPVLFHRSLAENIAYARPSATQGEIETAARLANAHGFIARLPHGYATEVGERGVKLSGGERQRIALARAFLADAPILILDEATSSLDSESEALIQEAVERLMQGRTTIVIAHRLSTVRAMDRILVFDAGRVVEEGRHVALVGRPGGIYRRLFDQQARDLARDHADEVAV